MKRPLKRTASDIPNQVGFTLSVLLRNGVWKNTSVVWSKGASMFHLNGVKISDVKTWEPLP